MTPQEVFDKVAKHLLTQKAKSMGEDEDTCMYRGANGLKCAVGILIEDDEYSPRMEMGVLTLLSGSDHVPCPASVYERLMPHTSLLSSLQQVHDANPVEGWEDSLKETAELHKLNWTIT